MKLAPIASGSNGNCILIQSDSARVLVDMGISYKEYENRMESIGEDPKEIDACFVTHEHSDHIRGVGVLARKIDVPIYLTKPTYEISKNMLGRIDNLRHFSPGDKISIGNSIVSTFSKPHDAIDPVSIVVEEKDERVGVFTDTGYCCDETKNQFSKLTSAVIESNYDPAMLSTCGYPVYLQRRISGEQGHLSNEDCAIMVLNNASKKLKSVFLGHLSANSNTPEKAFDTFSSIIKHRKDLNDLDIEVTSRYECKGIYKI